MRLIVEEDATCFEVVTSDKVVIVIFLAIVNLPYDNAFFELGDGARKTRDRH